MLNRGSIREQWKEMSVEQKKKKIGFYRLSRKKGVNHSCALPAKKYCRSWSFIKFFRKKNNIDRNEEKHRITGNIDRKNLVIK
jgi:hypothetical protein